MVEFSARHNYARISARKARLVVDLVRNLSVNNALVQLEFLNKKAAPMVKRVLNSAISNASQDPEVDVDALYISEAKVDEGPTMKRWRARAMGRATKINKRTCHIIIKLAEGERIAGKKKSKRKKKRKKKKR